MDYSRLQIKKHGPGNVMIIVCLVEEHILAILAIGGKVLQYALGGDTVLQAQSLPELETN